MTNSRSLPLLALGLLSIALVGCGGENALHVFAGWRGGICAILHVVAIVYAFVQILNSSADTGSKVLWGLVVFFMPVLGLILWYFFGPRSR